MYIILIEHVEYTHRNKNKVMKVHTLFTSVLCIFPFAVRIPMCIFNFIVINLFIKIISSLTVTLVTVTIVTVVPTILIFDMVNPMFTFVSTCLLS
jgi:hypothetical protein